jgi:peptidoglycan/LPS O-acetylase OafA/YrhL
MPGMNLGLRSLLLLVAIILFVVAAISSTNWDDYVAWGLAAFAASFLVGDTNLGSFAGGRRR